MIPKKDGEEGDIAKPLYGLTPVPRVRIPPSPPVFQLLTSLTCHSACRSLCQRKPNDFRVSLLHVRRGRCAVHVHRGSDVRVAHEPLLHSYRSSYGVQPTTVSVAERVRTDVTDASFCRCFSERLPHSAGPGLEGRATTLLPCSWAAV
jgi:hypothetical protein